MKYIILLVMLISVSVWKTGSPQDVHVNDLKLIDVDGKETGIPFLGKKLFVLFYIDPDRQHIIDPLTSAIDSITDPLGFEVVSVINCKDTWIPLIILRAGAKPEQKKYPDSPILFDRDHSLSSSWNFGKCDNQAVVVLIDRYSMIVYFKKLSSEQECKKIVPEILERLKGQPK
jgi:hypothetical protein